MIQAGFGGKVRSGGESPREWLIVSGALSLILALTAGALTGTLPPFFIFLHGIGPTTWGIYLSIIAANIALGIRYDVPDRRIRSWIGMIAVSWFIANVACTAAFLILIAVFTQFGSR